MPNETNTETSQIAAPRHHFDKPGRFEVDEHSGAGLSLREAGAGIGGGDLVSVTYKLPLEQLEEIARLLNEEREAIYVVRYQIERGNALHSLRGEVSFDADTSTRGESYSFTGHDGRARALECFDQCSERRKALQLGKDGSFHAFVELTRNGAGVKAEG